MLHRLNAHAVQLEILITIIEISWALSAYKIKLLGFYKMYFIKNNHTL